MFNMRISNTLDLILLVTYLFYLIPFCRRESQKWSPETRRTSRWLLILVYAMPFVLTLNISARTCMFFLP